MHPIVVILLFAAIGVLAYAGWRHEQKRLAALRQWASGRGWTLDRDRSRGWEREYPGLKVFGRGHSRSGGNVIRGEYRGHRVTLLDYRFKTGSGKNEQTHRRGVVLLHCDFPTIPLRIRRENLLDRVGELVGADDIDFESAEFSRTFHVSSSDRRWAYDVIHTRTMEYLLRAPKVEIEFGFGEIAVLHTGFCDGDAYEKSLQVAAHLHEMIPDYAIRQLKGSGK